MCLFQTGDVIERTLLLSVTLCFTAGQRDFAQSLRETCALKLSKLVTPSASRKQITALNFVNPELPLAYVTHRKKLCFAACIS